jgi:hypothetical protein
MSDNDEQPKPPMLSLSGRQIQHMEVLAEEVKALLKKEPGARVLIVDSTSDPELLRGLRMSRLLNRELVVDDTISLPRQRQAEDMAEKLSLHLDKIRPSLVLPVAKSSSQPGWRTFAKGATKGRRKRK